MILAAVGKPGYSRLVDAAVEFGKSKGGSVQDQTNAASDRLVSGILSRGVPSLIAFLVGGIWQRDPLHHSGSRLDRSGCPPFFR